MNRALAFLNKPGKEKLLSLKYRLLKGYQFLFPNKPYQIRIHNNLKWLVYKDWHNSAAVFFGRFDVQETEFLKRFLKRGWTVFDIGTHYGYYSLLMSQLVGEEGRVFSFEPAPLNRERLAMHVDINQISNIKIEPKAMGEERGIAEFFLADHNTGGNTLNPLTRYTYSQKLEVPVITLDEYCEYEINAIHFIKIDVEGFELKVFKGAKRALKDFQPIILLELLEVFGKPWHSGAENENGVIYFLTSIGYEFYRIETGGFLKNIDEGEVRRQNNYLAVPSTRKKEIEVLIK